MDSFLTKIYFFNIEYKIYRYVRRKKIHSKMINALPTFSWMFRWVARKLTYYRKSSSRSSIIKNPNNMYILLYKNYYILYQHYIIICEKLRLRSKRSII